MASDEDGFEVRAIFKVKKSIKEQPLDWWKRQMDWDEDVIEGDPPQPEDFDYLDVAKFVAKEWNATGDWWEYVDAAGTEWETVVLKEIAQIAETCTYKGCGRIKSDLIHREDDMRTTHKFVQEKLKCVREYLPGRPCGLPEDDIVHNWPLGGGGEHFFQPPKT